MNDRPTLDRALVRSIGAALRSFPVVVVTGTRQTGHLADPHWHTTTREEVDLVIEWKGQLLPIEVKAGARPRLADIKSLQSPYVCPTVLS